MRMFEAQRRRRTWVRERPWFVGTLTFVLFAIVGGFLVFPAWAATQGLPEEQVVVIDRTETGHTVRCGRRPVNHRPEYRVVYESENPPPGASKTFTNLEGCAPHSPGERLTIVRSEQYGVTTVWFEHPDTFGDAIWRVLTLAVPVAAGATILGYLIRTLARARARDEDPGPEFGSDRRD